MDIAAVGEEFICFQQFRDMDMAMETAEVLNRKGIATRVVKGRRYFDPSFAFNKTEPDIDLLLKPADFSKAREAMQAHYEGQLDSVDRSYYLFRFTDNELLDIIHKPDEWGNLDYALSGRILRDRGIEIPDELKEKIIQERITELARPEKNAAMQIISGYALAALGLFLVFVMGYFSGAFIGPVTGWLMAHLKKTLPNGERVFLYTDEVRKHGMIIQYVSSAIFLLILVGFLVKTI